MIKDCLKRRNKGRAALCLSMALAVLSVLMSFPAFALTQINGVSISIDSNISPGTRSTEVSAYTSSDRYEVEDVTVTNVPSSSSEWHDSSQPKLQIKLRLTNSDTYEWGNIQKGAVSVTGDPGDVTDSSCGVTAVQRNKDVLTIKYTMAPLDTAGEEGYDLYTHSNGWDELTGTAYWDGADDASYYRVILYRGNDKAAEVTTSDQSFCFAKYFTKAANYRFTVTAQAGKKKGNTSASAVYRVTASEAKDISANYGAETDKSTGVIDVTTNSQNVKSSAAGGPGANDSGSWVQDEKGWRFLDSSGAFASGAWRRTGGKWYYFGTDSYMVKGWNVIDGENYYFDNENGDLWVSRTTPDGYTVDASGKRIVNAVMVQNQTELGGSWQRDQNGWWYRFDNGSWPAAAWREIGGEWYYFGSDGYMMTGWQKIGGVYYYLDTATGAMWHDRVSPDGYRLDSNGASTKP